MISFSDSEKVFTEIMNRIVEPHGKKFTLEIKLQQMGKKVREAGKYMIGECKRPQCLEADFLKVHYHGFIIPSKHLLMVHIFFALI